ncbi:hypothetical protein B0T25DRAFT_548526 [Lasiosphaeria hispida]|uniref:Uncharacterized protein n=1 Tax=Lasiosphaeria hispida TaxID=260671 RepID=A0AAJ0HEW8_9PEZI|nr:hypothetical protein B0T25DRAFT_548526 [Lasiosphaeria hispida]
MCKFNIVLHTLRCDVRPSDTSGFRSAESYHDSSVSCSLSRPWNCGSGCPGPILSDGRPIPAWFRCTFGHRCCLALVRIGTFPGCACDERQYKFHLYEPSRMLLLQKEWGAHPVMGTNSRTQVRWLAKALGHWANVYAGLYQPLRGVVTKAEAMQWDEACVLEQRGKSVIPSPAAKLQDYIQNNLKHRAIQFGTTRRELTRFDWEARGRAAHDAQCLESQAGSGSGGMDIDSHVWLRIHIQTCGSKCSCV